MIPKSGHRFSEKIMFQQKIRPSPCSSERIRLPPGNIAMRFRRACLVALLLAFSYVLGCTVAHTASLDEALAHFTTDDFGETIVGVNEVAASGDPRALIIIRALQDGQLLYSAQKKAVYLKNESGKLTDGATGQSIAGPPPADLESVRLNNRLRGTIDAALGGLTLLAKDPGARYDAAQSVFKSRRRLLNLCGRSRWPWLMLGRRRMKSAM